MRPLRELSDSPDALEARAARLVRSQKPFSASAERKQRLLERVENAPPPSLSSRLARAAISPAGAVLLALAAAAVLWAAAGTTVRAPETRPASVPAPPPAPPSSAPAATAIPAPEPPTAPSPVMAPPPESAVETASPPPRAAPFRRRPAERDTAPPSPPVDSVDVEKPSAPPIPEEEAILVQTALKALRQDRDPERAAVLLDDYLDHHPHGALVEEALRLAIEAAVANHDPRAVSLSERYLRRFPSGRYRRTAERALGR